MPLKVDEGLDVLVIVPPIPLMILHKPVPIVATFPAKVAVVPHIFWFGPAAAIVGTATPVIVTWLDVGGQGALLIVH